LRGVDLVRRRYGGLNVLVWFSRLVLKIVDSPEDQVISEELRREGRGREMRK
jgi:hypothetical protein